MLSLLSLIYITRAYFVVLVKSACSSHLKCVSIFYQINLLVFNRLFVLRVVLIKFDPLVPLGLSLVKSNLLLDWLDINNLIGKVRLRFYRAV
jgi:hypothetical protein